jgi:hypothetical protein
LTLFAAPPSRERPSRRCMAVLAFAAFLFPSSAVFALAVDDSGAAAATQAAAPITVSLADYQSKLQTLDQLVAKCQQKMIPANCDSEAVGPDIQLILPGGTRQVRLNWLRGVLADAAKAESVRARLRALEEKKKADAAKAKAATPEQSKNAPASDDDNDADDSSSDSDTQPGAAAVAKVEFASTTIEQRLTLARQRLEDERRWASGTTETSAPKADANAAQEHQALNGILSAKEYKATVVNPSLKDRLLEKVARWINQAIGKLVNAGSKSKWIGAAAEIGFGVVICVALVWFLIRLEKQGRFTASMIRSGPGEGAASARDWQLWLKDARDAAAKQAWRDAIHLLYWASISRLEGSGLWPADRARTPREYLALLSPESQHRPDLGTLTRSFERTWYAGRAANEADFQAAEQLAAKLGAKSKEGAA